MLCLSLLLPGKIGQIARKIMPLLISAVLIYVLLWGYIMKSIQFEVLKQDVVGKTLHLTLLVRNESFGDITFEDINLVNENGKAVAKRLHGFPTVISKYADRTVQASFAVDRYSSIRSRIKALGVGYTFENDLRRS